MLYRIVIIFILCLIPSICLGGTCWNGGSSGSSPWSVRLAADHNADSCEYADVNYCVNTVASAEDTVNVPVGSCTWNSTLITTKGINLIGAGIGQTVITYGSIGGGIYDFLIQHKPSDYDADNAYRLSGFTFDLNSAGPGLALGYDKTSPFTVQTKIRVDHNSIINATGRPIWNYCNFYGVVDNNTITMTSHIKSDAADTEFGFWDNSPQNVFTSGSEKYMYFEDNIINNSSSDHHAFESQYSARWVARYNTMNLNAITQGVFEVHGHQTSGSMGSVFGTESYGNRILSVKSDCRLMTIRGGKHFSYYNYINNTSNFHYAYTSLVTCPSRYEDQMMINNTYLFQNYDTNSLVGITTSGDIDGCGLYDDRPMTGRDLMGDNSSPASVGCGTSLPAEPCTNLSGYWVTSQGCTTSAVQGYVGDKTTYPSRGTISGTLYQCQSGAWVSYYTPYTYPHPLRGEGIIPSSVQGLTIQGGTLK